MVVSHLLHTSQQGYFVTTHPLIRLSLYLVSLLILKKHQYHTTVRAQMHYGGLTRYRQIQESRNDNYNDIKLYCIFHIECKDSELTRVVQ